MKFSYLHNGFYTAMGFKLHVYIMRAFELFFNFLKGYRKATSVGNLQHAFPSYGKYEYTQDDGYRYQSDNGFFCADTFHTHISPLVN
ncbi:hypothetical protein ES703_11570 [subsurface metagenome]